MIIRPQSPNKKTNPTAVRLAWQAFAETQQVTEAPAGIVLQPDHAKLSGEIAASLLPSAFGELASGVVDAIASHDAGWLGADLTQLRTSADHAPRPFLSLPAEQTMPCWVESVREAEAISPLTGILVSRHFCALASQNAAYSSFLSQEGPRREQLEREFAFRADDLERWTAALGFCDVVSLYLCCGATEPVDFALAHPALPQAREARRVHLDWVDGQPRFSTPVFQPGATFAVTLFERTGESAEFRSRDLVWKFSR